jgi:hypothetical protein
MFQLTTIDPAAGALICVHEVPPFDDRQIARRELGCQLPQYRTFGVRRVGAHRPVHGTAQRQAAVDRRPGVARRACT